MMFETWTRRLEPGVSGLVQLTRARLTRAVDGSDGCDSPVVILDRVQDNRIPGADNRKIDQIADRIIGRINGTGLEHCRPTHRTIGGDLAAPRSGLDQTIFHDPIVVGVPGRRVKGPHHAAAGISITRILDRSSQ